MRPILIAPSLLSADFSKLAEEVKAVKKAGADLLHIDVMDGHFVPNITIGPVVVKAIKSLNKLPLDVHLMIENPDKYIEDFIKAGADILSVHIEACKNPKKTLRKIESLGVRPVIAINPPTPISAIKGVLDCVDMVLVMSVNPGFGGQHFIPSVLPKIKTLRKKFAFKDDIEIDGGVGPEVARACVEAGVNILVAGTAVFGKKNRKLAIKQLRNASLRGA